MKYLKKKLVTNWNLKFQLENICGITALGDYCVSCKTCSVKGVSRACVELWKQEK